MSPTLALATVAGVIASGLPFGLLACRLDPGPLAHRRKDRPTVQPGPLANDERSPDWCHRHGCHRSACPGPE
jgi:hypothetical protein